jgi:hypothetical protein
LQIRFFGDIALPTSPFLSLFVHAFLVSGMRVACRGCMQHQVLNIRRNQWGSSRGCAYIREKRVASFRFRVKWIR